MTEKYTASITVEGGKICGTMSGDEAVNIFKGIPYAAPPVGNLRWRAPAPVIAWDGVRKCTDWSASAIQSEQKPFAVWTKEFIIADTGYSEDCLYLNVWAPNDGRKNHPVIVYFHGGNYITGGSSCAIYDGTNFARNGVVIVTFNFRVGTLGLLATSELSAESEHGVSGNYMLLDQIKALRWVKENIAQFGGSPDNVTIMGQSTGGGSVNCLTVSPLAEGLFHKAVSLSYNNAYICVHRFSGKHCDFVPLKQLEAEGDRIFLKRTAEEMRAMSPQELSVFPVFSQMAIDGYVLPSNFRGGIQAHRTDNIPMIMGAVAADGGMQFPHWATKTKGQHELNMMRFFGSDGEKAEEIYPFVPTTRAWQTHPHMSDRVKAALLAVTRMRNSNHAAPTWLSWFSQVLPGPMSEIFGAFHTSEMPYIFNTIAEERKPACTPGDFEVADRMMRYITNFAASGNPNGEGLPSWNPSDGSTLFEIEAGKFSDITLPAEVHELWMRKFETIGDDEI